MCDECNIPPEKYWKVLTALYIEQKKEFERKFGKKSIETDKC